MNEQRMTEAKSPMQVWLSEYSKDSTRVQNRFRFGLYLKWTGKTDKQLVEEFDQKKVRSQILQFQNYLLNEYQAVDAKGRPKPKKGLAKGTVRAIIGAVRAFYTSQRESVKGLNGKIVKYGVAKGEHVFSTSDLRKMWHVANTRDKAILAFGCSLGWGVSGISEMEREFFEKLVKRARSEGLEFIAFDWERVKTGAQIYGILTPVAMNSIKRWLEKTKDSESKWLWSINSTGHLSVDALNDILRYLAKEAGIVTTGRIRWHLLRKWLISSLSTAGLVEWETKLVTGKEIPVSDATYLAGLKQSAYEKYCKAYPEHLSLVSYTNDTTKIEQVSERIERLEGIIKDYAIKSGRQETKIDILEKTVAEQNEQIDKLMKAVAKQKAKRLFGERKE